MDIDPVTQQEARRIEQILRDLVADLELISYLPSDFSYWLRDGVIPDVNRFDKQLDEVSAAANITAACKLRSELSSDMIFNDNAAAPQLCKAGAFLQAAAYYGDPADGANNQLVQRVGKFYEAERELLDAASRMGTVDAEDLSFYRLSARALIDDLRQGGFEEHMVAYLRRLCPHTLDETKRQERTTETRSAENRAHSTQFSLDSVPPTLSESFSEDSSMSSICSEQVKSDVAEAQPGNMCESRSHGHKQKAFGRVSARSQDYISDSVDRFRYVVRVLLKLIHLRNTTTANEDVHRNNILHEAVNREKSATADVQALNQAYEEIKESRQREVAELDQEIGKLEAEIECVQHTADAELEAFNEVNFQTQEARRSAYKQQIENQRQASVLQEEKLKQVEAQHMAEITTLRSVKAKTEAAVSGAIAEYEAEMRLVHNTLTRLHRETEEETAQIVTLEEQLSKLQKEQHEYDWDIRVAEQRQEHANSIAQRYEQNARVLQAYYRAYAARRRYEKEIEAKKRRCQRSKQKK